LFIKEKAMDNIFLDAETYYSKGYSLRDMTTVEYVRHELFSIIGWSVAVNDGPVEWFDKLPDLDYGNSRVIAHNMLFDGLILHEKYGVRAKEWCCTQALSMALLPLKSNSLKEVSRLLNVGEKGDGLTEGSNEADSKLIEYAIQDTELCRGIFNKLHHLLPVKERLTLHYTLRWGVEASLCVNVKQMETAADTAEALQQTIIEQALQSFKTLPRSALTSSNQLASWLKEQGIVVPYKPGKNMDIPALAQGDPEFHAMIADPDNTEYAEVFAARKAATSSINIKRPRLLAKIARMSSGQLLPMPLKYCGAHTTRWSGSGGYNVQNLPNGSVARTAITAPAGHVIVVVDSSQIELRINAWWSGELGILKSLNEGRCLYIEAAAHHYKKDYSYFTKQSPERKFGKALTLGSGYGMGARTFKAFCGAGPLGMAPMILTIGEAKAAIDSYRDANPNIVDSWEVHEKHLDALMKAQRTPNFSHPIKGGVVTVANNSLILPNGLHMQYPHLRYSRDEESMLYGGKLMLVDGDYELVGAKYIYGPKLQENIVQGLARVVISDQLQDIEAKGIRTVSSTHDEILAIATEAEADDVYKEMVASMSISPTWAPDLPLTASGGHSFIYCK
jgi:DNA polymerase